MISLSKFLRKREKTAKSVDEAKELLLEELGLSEDDVEFSIVDEGSKGFLGIGSKGAVVEATIIDYVPYKAKAFLKEVFEGMKLDVTIETVFENDSLTVNLSGEHMGIIIGKRGDTLDSLQYLTSLVVNHDSDDYIKVTLDTENYREKRYHALVALAKRLAHKVTKSGKKYTLEPMNPYERRIIHAELQDSETVTTFSVGEDPYRKVVIAPKNPARNTYYKKSTQTPVQNNLYSQSTKKHTDFESYIQSFESDETEE